VAVGVPHFRLGTGIVLIASAPSRSATDTDLLLAALRRRLPRYMLPLMVDWRDSLPRNANGKFDRARLRQEAADRFVDVGPADADNATDSSGDGS